MEPSDRKGVSSKNWTEVPWLQVKGQMLMWWLRWTKVDGEQCFKFLSSKSDDVIPIRSSDNCPTKTSNYHDQECDITSNPAKIFKTLRHNDIQLSAYPIQLSSPAIQVRRNLHCDIGPSEKWEQSRPDHKQSIGPQRPQDPPEEKPAAPWPSCSWLQSLFPVQNLQLPSRNRFPKRAQESVRSFKFQLPIVVHSVSSPCNALSHSSEAIWDSVCQTGAGQRTDSWSCCTKNIVTRAIN